MSRIKDDSNVPVYNIDQVLSLTSGIVSSEVRLEDKLIISKPGVSVTDYNTSLNLQLDDYNLGTGLIKRSEVSVTGGGTGDYIYLSQNTLRIEHDSGFNSVRGGYHRVFNSGNGSGQWVIGHRAEITDNGSGSVTTGFYAGNSSLNITGSGSGTIALANGHNVYNNYANTNKTITTALGLSVKAEGGSPIGTFTLLNLDANVTNVTGSTCSVIGITSRPSYPSGGLVINSLMDRPSFIEGFIRLGKSVAEIDADGDGSNLVTVDWVNDKIGGGSSFNYITETGDPATSLTMEFGDATNTANSFIRLYDGPNLTSRLIEIISSSVSITSTDFNSGVVVNQPSLATPVGAAVYSNELVELGNNFDFEEEFIRIDPANDEITLQNY